MTLGIKTPRGNWTEQMKKITTEKENSTRNSLLFIPTFTLLGVGGMAKSG